jgi:hypothetical protein
MVFVRRNWGWVTKKKHKTLESKEILFRILRNSWEKSDRGSIELKGRRSQLHAAAA